VGVGLVGRDRDTGGRVVVGRQGICGALHGKWAAHLADELSSASISCVTILVVVSGLQASSHRPLSPPPTGGRGEGDGGGGEGAGGGGEG
jgi:hypothetical protein